MSRKVPLGAIVLLATALGAACGPDPAGRAAPQSRPGVAHPTACALAPVADSVSPSREGFFREVLFAAATRRTPRFDDYTPGSYHADKLDLAAGLPAEAARCGAELRGLLVVGPVGGLWTYHVAAFLSDGDSMRVNSLVMPHARITGKGTGRVSPVAVDSLFSALTRSPLVRPGTPSFPDSLGATLSRDFSYNLLAVRYDGGAPRYWHAEFWGALRGDSAAAAGVERLLAPLNRVLAVTRETYPDTQSSTPR